MPQPGHVLILCTANICRSPMAEGLLAHALAAQPEPLKSIKVVSAGVSARPNEPVSEYSVVALKKVGIDIAGHKARAMSRDLLDGAIAVFGMTESHRAMVQLRAAPAPQHLYLFREFLPKPAHPEIPDPYGGPLKLYEAARDEMVEAVPSIVEFLKKMTADPKK
jgi:protein-tyrosine-phosphatase